ncbi:MAG: hypothetical protein R3Y56_00270 [Akkermansia sp.]
MKHHILPLIAASALACLCSSCLIQQAVEVFIRNEYPGELPPAVIQDVNGKPASNKWLSADPNALPTPQNLLKNTSIEYAEDGIPYCFTSEFSDVLVSPYHPYHQLSYKGLSGGTKVWDPYTRKPFYITRVHTIN